jgi:copper(I)-binding protein
VTTIHRPRSRRAALIAVTCLALGGVAGCSGSAPLETPSAEVRGGAIGPDEAVSQDVKVLQVQLEYPLDGAYEIGEDASLYLAVSNTGTVADTLVAVRGPDFATVRTTGAGDGHDLAITIPADDNVYIGAEGEPAVTLVGLSRELRSSQSTPVTLTFARAGTVTVDAVVADEGQSPAQTFDFPSPDEDPTGDGDT